MSTDYYDICPNCLKQIIHWHRKQDSDDPVAHSYYGGEDKGLVLDTDPKYSDDALVISEYGEIITIGSLRTKVGNGKKP